MNDKDTIELDEETLADLDRLAKEEGMTMDEYLRKLLFDRASTLLKQKKAKPSLFLP